MTNDDKHSSVFRDNLIALIGDGSVNAWAKAHGLEQTTVNRIINGETEPRLSMIERVAKALRCEAWQLLVPGFAIDKRPSLENQARNDAQDLADRMNQVLAELQEIKEAAGLSPGAAPGRRKAAR